MERSIAGSKKKENFESGEPRDVLKLNRPFYNKINIAFVSKQRFGFFLTPLSFRPTPPALSIRIAPTDWESCLVRGWANFPMRTLSANPAPAGSNLPPRIERKLCLFAASWFGSPAGHLTVLEVHPPTPRRVVDFTLRLFFDPVDFPLFFLAPLAFRRGDLSPVAWGFIFR